VFLQSSSPEADVVKEKDQMQERLVPVVKLPELGAIVGEGVCLAVLSGQRPELCFSVTHLKGPLDQPIVYGQCEHSRVLREKTSRLDLI